MLNRLIKKLKTLRNKDKAKILQGFFKTGKGQYGEGDIFLGITVPVQRKVAQEHSDLSLEDLQTLIRSKIHEYRLVGLLILVDKYKKTENKKEIFDFYLKNASGVNNWDLVDLTAPNIVGNFLLDKKRNILLKYAKSKNLWEKRISIVATFTFIRNNQFEETLKISEILMNNTHDLIHKATGWMLREVGKRDLNVLENFLQKHYKDMPRTMLRYAIEKFPEERRKAYLKGEI